MNAYRTRSLARGLWKVMPPLLVAIVMAITAPMVFAAPQQGQLGTSATSASVSVQRGETVTTPPVRMQEVSGTQLTVTFVATPSTAGTLTVTAMAVGRSATYTLRAPREGTVTAKAATLSAATTVAGTTKAGPLPATVLVRVLNASGQVVAQCDPPVAANGVATLPASCQSAGAAVTLAPLVVSEAQIPASTLPRSLPSTGGGGTARTAPSGAAPALLLVALTAVMLSIFRARRRPAPNATGTAERAN